MTPRDNDDARSDQPVDRPEAQSVEDEAAEPTVTRLSRADVRRYEQSVTRSPGASGEHPQPAQPPAEGDAGEWHEVSGDAGARGAATPDRHLDRPAAGPAAEPTSGPESEPTPAREPHEGDDARSRGGRRGARRRPAAAGAVAEAGDQPLAAGSDQQPTRPFRRPETSEEAPTVVSRGPLVGEAHGSTRVMGGQEGRRRSGAAPGTAGATAATGAAAAAAAGTSARPGEQDQDEEAALRAERRAEREARDRALGKRRPQPVAPTPVEPPSTKLSRTTDRFHASLGLFLLRLGVAAVLGIHGAQQLMDIPATIEQFAGTALPYPEIFAWATAVASVLIAVALVLGLAVRAAGLGAALIGAGALVFVYWWRSPFESGLAGFRGESELLVAVLGVFLLLVGGGAWGIDAAIRKGRLQRRAEKFEAEQI